VLSVITHFSCVCLQIYSVGRYPKQVNVQAAVSLYCAVLCLSGRSLAQNPTGSSALLPLSIQDHSLTILRQGNEHFLPNVFQFTIRGLSPLQPQIVGPACSTCGGEERRVLVLVGEPTERDIFEDKGVDGRRY
jgi:hypothetical protein